jgi:hypothetical protein
MIRSSATDEYYNRVVSVATETPNHSSTPYAPPLFVISTFPMRVWTNGVPIRALIAKYVH